MAVSNYLVQLSVLEQALQRIERFEKRIAELELKLKHYSAHYSEGGSGEYVNNEEAMNRFEGKT